MLYCGCIVFIKNEKINEVKEFLSQYEEISIYTQSEDNSALIIVIEDKTDKQIEEFLNKLKQNEYIIDVSPHYLHFEEEVERILKTGEKPDLTGFSKSERRKVYYENR